jgi:transaldolase
LLTFDSSLAVAEKMADTLGKAGNDLEGAGACIMIRVPVSEVGVKLGDCGQALDKISKQLLDLAPEQVESKECSQRMAYAAQKMAEAANELQSLKKPTPTGKGWLKQ